MTLFVRYLSEVDGPDEGQFIRSNDPEATEVLVRIRANVDTPCLSSPSAVGFVHHLSTVKIVVRSGRKLRKGSRDHPITSAP